MTTPTHSSGPTMAVLPAPPVGLPAAVLTGLLQGPRPIVQVSIDVPSVDEAISIGTMALRAGVDVLEVGTPLILAQGLAAMTPFVAALPGAPIFVDIKIVDGARKYVVAAAEKGGHLVSICGVASDASIRQALAGGRDSGIIVVVDLYAAPDPVTRARQVVDMGAPVVYVHYGGDARAEDPAGDDTLEMLERVKASVSVPVGVVTFDADGGAAAVRAGADIVLVGHPFLVGPDAEPMLTDYVARVKAAGQ